MKRIELIYNPNSFSRKREIFNGLKITNLPSSLKTLKYIDPDGEYNLDNILGTLIHLNIELVELKFKILTVKMQQQNELFSLENS